MWYLKIKTKLYHLAVSVCLIITSLAPIDAQASLSALSSARLKSLDDDTRVRLNAAMRDMRRRGIRPRVNSTFRSQAEQRALYRCSHNRRCRARRGIYGAKRPGTSMHEAGLAVDIGGVAKGGRRRRLTSRGRKVVQIMRKHGFKWRYGMRDPVHFELSPQTAGYRTEKAAIKAGQQRWLANNRARRRARRQA
ncbi:MAG TPA: M15 family metallopeptidase [Blastocatellia bacterium]|nr:M15 family metallopeptidase [Blastocatellia bacterium]